MTKDNFSSASDKYAKYRPTYPKEVYDYLNGLVAHKDTAWDCGTGNGQVARELAKSFDQVFATDLSSNQIAQAWPADNIHYSVQPAETTDFDDQLFDLITVAQAIHWFDFEKFYAEVRRTAKPSALLAVMGYDLIAIDAPIDTIIRRFYSKEIGPYWDRERRYIDEHYRTIPFPFDEITTPQFANRQHWTIDHLAGYLRTWSAVKHFIRENEYDPVDTLMAELAPHWQAATLKEVCFPILLRIGTI